MTAPQYRFRWTCSFMGQMEYEVIGDGAPYRVEVRREAGAYERSIFNGDETEWQRDVVAAVDVLHRVSHPEKPVPAGVVEAFNGWLQERHAAHAADIARQPDRYGVLAEDDPILKAPRAVRGGHYVVDRGWVIA